MAVVSYIKPSVGTRVTDSVRAGAIVVQLDEMGESDKTSALRTFKYVYIPVDKTKPMTELRHETNSSLEDDNLREKLREHFAARASLSCDALDSYVASLKQKVSSKTSVNLRQVALSISVETYALTIPSKEFPLAVSLYTDEKAVAKKLELNERAMGLSRACGAKQELRGDCFVSRYFDDDDQWIRKDFCLSDCSSDAPWIRQARNNSKGGGMASLSSLYDQLGGSSQDPVKIDATQVIQSEMEKTRTHGENVVWHQTDTDVEICVMLPAGVNKRDIKVVSHRKSLSIHLEGWKLLHFPDLFSHIDPDATCWTLDASSRVLNVTLEKAALDAGAWTQLDALTCV